MKAILNYTTTIEAEKTAMEIQLKLSKSGARAVLCEYDPEGVLSAMSFRLNTAYGDIFFRLPAQLEGVYRSLKANSNVAPRFRTKEQATRVAWRILKDWVEAQLAMVQAGLAESTEVFLPYAQSQDGKTVYESLRDKGFLQLTHRSGHE